MAILSFVSAIRSGSDNQTERRYLDYCIDGQSLRTILPVAAAVDMISPFGWMGDRHYERQQIEQLVIIRNTDLKTGRVRLYICPECGDIDCASISVEVISRDDQIIWQRFANETGYGGITEYYSNVNPIVFDKADYMKTFMRLHQGFH